MKLSTPDRLCYITLLCLASSSEEQGIVTNCDEESLIQLTHLYDDPYNEDNEYRRAKGCLSRFEKMGMITNDNKGNVIINAFLKRQGSNLTGYERLKKHREKMKNVESKPLNIDNEDNVINDNDRIDKIRKEKKRKEGTNTSEQSSQEIPKIIDLFKEVNPSYKKWFGNKTQRSAITRMLEVHGYEKLEKIIALLPKTNGMDYMPSITTPLQLEDKFAQLATALQKYKNNKPIIL